MAELKPCPFCGHSAALESVGADHFVMCDGCCAESARWQSPTGDAESAKRRAVESWNRRATDGQRDTARGVPEGFTVKRSKSGREILVQEEELGGIWTRAVGYDGMAERLLHRLAELWLASAPTPPDGDAERDRRDAERYRWLRVAENALSVCEDGLDPIGAYIKTGDDLDSAIDAAMAASKGSGHG